jgi:hypothetical protein
MRVSRVCLALAVVAWLQPTAVEAGEAFFFCHDDTGVPESLRIDVAHKRVTMISGRSPGRCLMEFADGAFGPVYENPQGEYCVFTALSQGQSAREFVSVSGNSVTFGATGEGGTQKFTLDMANGILDYAGGPDECHKARG